MKTLPWIAAALPWCFIVWIGAPRGHDLPLELIRLAEYQRALRDLQLPPYWATHLYAGFGSPIFLFYGHVCLLLASLLAWIAGSLVIGLLLALSLATLIAVIGLQGAGSSWSASSQPSAAGRVASYLFVLNPYLIGDAFLRNASAEYVALCGMPIGLYGLALTAREPRRALRFLAIGTAWVSAAHNLSALSWLAIASALIFVDSDRSARLRRVEGLAFGIALAAFAWLPALRWKPLIQSEQLLTGKFDFHSKFLAWSNMFGDHFASVGPLPLMAAVLALIALRRATAPERTLMQRLLALAVGTIVLQMRVSIPLWEHSGVLPYFQFPFRFMGPFALVTALLGGLAFARITDRFRSRTRRLLELLVLSLCLVPAILQLSHVQPLALQERRTLERLLQPELLRRTVQSSTEGDEYLPRQASLEDLLERASTSPVGSATEGLRIAIKRDEPRHISLLIGAARGSEMCLTRWWFPFWQITLDRRVQLGASCRDGSIRVSVPAGRHEVTVDLDPPIERSLGLIISLFALLALWLRLRSTSFTSLVS